MRCWPPPVGRSLQDLGARAVDAAADLIQQTIQQAVVKLYVAMKPNPKRL